MVFIIKKETPRRKRLYFFCFKWEGRPRRKAAYF